MDSLSERVKHRCLNNILKLAMLNPWLLASGLFLPCLCWCIFMFTDALLPQTVAQWNGLKPSAGFTETVLRGNIFNLCRRVLTRGGGPGTVCVESCLSSDFTFIHNASTVGSRSVWTHLGEVRLDGEVKKIYDTYFSTSRQHSATISFNHERSQSLTLTRYLF